MRFHLAVITLFSAGSLAAGTVTTYADQAAFLAAARSIPNTTTELETFNGPNLTAPGLSVATKSIYRKDSGAGYGRIADGVWADCVGHNCDPHESLTTWTFAQPVYAFGATFNYEGWASWPITVGLSFDYDWINPPLQDGFFGFISDQPMSSLVVVQNVWRIWPSEFPPGLPLFAVLNAQPYTMDNLYLQVDPPGSSAPEPASWAFMLFGTLGLVLGRRFLRPAANAPNLHPERQAIHCA